MPNNLIITITQIINYKIKMTTLIDRFGVATRLAQGRLLLKLLKKQHGDCS